MAQNLTRPTLNFQGGRVSPTLTQRVDEQEFLIDSDRYPCFIDSELIWCKHNIYPIYNTWIVQRSAAGRRGTSRPL